MASQVHLWLRAETKENEQRTHLTPQKCRELLQSGFKVTVELSKQRVFEDEAYKEIQGINIVPEGSWPNAPKDAYILGIKELPNSNEPITQQHVYFAHAYKYQTGWANLLNRFKKGGGSVLDVEYLTNEKGQRTVVAFPHMAGFTGMALGVLSWCHKLLHPKSSMPGVKPFASEQLLVNHVKKQIEKVSEIKGISELFPKIIIIGALGRCGKGALDLANKVGIPASHLGKWDINETKKGGPFKEILNYDIFVNCICLTKVKEPLTISMYIIFIINRSYLPQLVGNVQDCCVGGRGFNPWPDQHSGS
ncbi:saccharopine dehydrogenase [NAD(+), L-lysine-forming]-like [Actinia tenebrosa]|uniref:Saccharopine dehydrogenase [NAD(+), L-lysine-forming]-like n=1 Tax=Actinia tenebrosa TaxID=6105 RepID=A0A6P8IB92_ACTTE|nr:saccharopine dehydrogenase [NAD(+), L-lysine-forming]-like [Actinia tenebrosa]